MEPHGQVNYLYADRVLIIQPAGAFNKDAIDELNAMLPELRITASRWERPYLRITDLRMWKLGTPEAYQEIRRFSQTCWDIGFRHGILISSPDGFINSITKENLHRSDESDWFYVSTPQEAWEKAHQLGYSPPTAPDFLSFRS